MTATVAHPAAAGTALPPAGHYDQPAVVEVTDQRTLHLHSTSADEQVRAVAVIFHDHIRFL